MRWACESTDACEEGYWSASVVAEATPLRVRGWRFAVGGEIGRGWPVRSFDTSGRTVCWVAECPQVGAEIGGQGLVAEGLVEGGLEEAEGVAAVEAGAFEFVGVEGLGLGEGVEGVHEPDFAGASGWGLGEDVEEAGASDEAADGGEVGGGVFAGGFLDDGGDSVEAGLDGLGGDDAVARDLVIGDLLDGEDGAAEAVVDVDKLFDGGDVVEDDVVGEEDGEGVVADEVAGDEDGVAVAAALLLVDDGEGDAGESLEGVEEVALAGAGEEILEVRLGGEVLFDGAFGGVGDEDDVVEAGGEGFLDDVLDDGAVEDGEHFFWDDFGGGEEAGAEAGGEDDGFADGHGGSLA